MWENMEGSERGCGGLREVVEEESSRDFLIHHGMLSMVPEDEKEEEEEEEESDGSSLFSIDIDAYRRVYVAVGKGESSMPAFVWTLKHGLQAPSSSTVIHLIHVFPVIRFVPSPLGGLLPKSQANPKVVESYLAIQRDKRTKLLQPYIDACSAAQVKVRTLLVESDSVAKAILELIPELNIRRLILGSTKSTLRKVKSKKGTASQIVRNAPNTCEIKIICKGKEVINQPSIGWSSPRGSSANSLSTHEDEDEKPGLSSPDIRRPHSNTDAKPVSIPAWNVFKWVRTKPASTFGPRITSLPPISSVYENLHK